MLRLLRLALGVVLGVELFYLVGMNVFLSTPLFEKVVDFDPLMIDIHYKRAWSFWPTHVHAEGLSIRSTDGNVQWILKLDEVTFDVGLLALPKQQFHVSKARGSGISFRMRLRMPSPAQTPELSEQLAPIDGLGPAAFKPSDPPWAGDYDDTVYNLWTINLEDVVAEHVREVWVDRGRLTGDVRIAGGFYLKPLRRVAVGPIDLDVREGDADFAGVRITDGLRGPLYLNIDAFEPRQITDLGLLHQISFRANLATAIPDAKKLAVVDKGVENIDGRLDVPRLGVNIDHGVFKEGTDIALSSAGLVVHAGQAPWGGGGGGGAGTKPRDVTFKLGFDAKVENDTFRFHTTVSDLDAAGVITVPSLAVSGESQALDLAGPLGDLRTKLDVEDVHVDDVCKLPVWLGADTPRFTSGALRVAVHAQAERIDFHVHGKVGVTATNLGLSRGSYGLHGSGHAALTVADMAFPAGGGAHIGDTRAEVRVDDGLVATNEGDPMMRLRGLVRGHAASIDPGDPTRAIDAGFDLSEVRFYGNGEVAKFLPPEVVLPEEGLAARMKGEASMKGRGRFRRIAGRADVSAEHARVIVRGMDLSTRLEAHADAHEVGDGTSTVIVDDARLELSDVVATSGSGGAAAASETGAVGSIGTLEKLAVRMVSSHLDPDDPLAVWQARARIQNLAVHDLGPLNQLLPSGVHFAVAPEGGLVSANVVARRDENDISGVAEIRARGVGAAGTHVNITGDVTAFARVDKWMLKEGIVEGPAIRLSVADVSGSFVKDDLSAGGKEGATAAATPQPVRDFTADRIAMHAWAPKLTLGEFSLHNLEADLDVGHASLPDARSLNRILSGGDIVAIESGKADVAIDMHLHPHVADSGGLVDVRLHDAGVRLHDTHLAGNFTVRARLRDYDGAKSQVRLGGSQVYIRDVKVSGAATATSSWFGDVVLQDGFLRFDQTPHLEGDVTLSARDASPVFALLLGDGFPSFLASLTRMPRLDAATHLVVEPSKLVVSHAIASGGDIAVRGAYAVRGDESRGAFVVQKGPLSAGVGIANGGVSLRLFGLNGWLREQTARALAGMEVPGDETGSSGSVGGAPAPVSAPLPATTSGTVPAAPR